MENRPFVRVRDDENEVPALIALGAVFAVACFAGLAAASQSISFALEEGRVTPVAPVAKAVSCRICGVVESVRVVDPVPAKHEVSTVVGGGTEGIAVLLSALSGRPMAGEPSRSYEVLVRMDDGSMRATRERVPPGWKAGDRVRFLKGGIERSS